MEDNNIYKEEGYESREEYLKFLAEDYDIEYAKVKEFAMMLGPSEDFDGLISALETCSPYSLN